MFSLANSRGVVWQIKHIARLRPDLRHRAVGRQQRGHKMDCRSVAAGVDWRDTFSLRGSIAAARVALDDLAR